MRLAILFLIFVFLSYILLEFGYDLSRSFSHIDALFHFLGGFGVAMFFGAYLKNLNPGNPGSPALKKAFIIISAAVFVGVFWEFLEYLGTAFLGDHLYQNYRIVCCMGDLDDTVSDLVVDILGASTFVWVFLNPLKSNSRLKHSSRR